MTRSTKLRAAVAGGLLSGLLLLSGCGSSHDAQSADHESTIVGVNARTPDGKIALLDAHVLFAREYAAGKHAPLVLRIVNESGRSATLSAVTVADNAGTVVVVSKVPPTPAPASASATAAATAAASVSASPSGTRRPSASPTASAPASAPATAAAVPTSATPTTPPPLGSPSISIPLPVDSFVLLVPDQSDRWLAVNQLRAPVTAGGSVVLTFTFTYADGTTSRLTDLRVPVGVPATAGPRVTPSAGEGEH